MATADADVKKVLNFLKSNGGGISTVVYEWKSEDGLSWYRKWSNGLIEQWTRSEKSNNVLVTLPTSFSDTNYVVVISRHHNGYYEDTSMSCFIVDVSTVRIWGKDNNPRFIYACGY